MALWCTVQDPDLRNAIALALRFRGVLRFPDQVARVHAALEASRPIKRNADRVVHGTRGRGRKRGR
jgi:hypothetical protein